jgi:acetamidase/formamidase
MKSPWSIALCVFPLVGVNALAASSGPDFTGRWEVTTSYPGGSYVAGLDLTAHDKVYDGKSGYLVPDCCWYAYSGALEKDGLHLKVLGPDGKSEFGRLTLTINKGVLAGLGVLHEVPVTISGRRPIERPANAPRIHDFAPQVFYRAFSGANPPALHIFPGDTVRTQTVDANGGGATDSQRSLPGNPQTGPFYVEGAMIGDTISVHFNKIRPNRDTAFQYRGGLSARVLPPGYSQPPPAPEWSDIWNIDREHGTATPANPSDKLKGLVVKLTPMLGCVGVAPYWNQAIGTSDLGPFGGNLDYNQVREGVTLYLPVYQAGALLTVGDGHAVQGDGEITGQGLETSMEVEFTVELIRNQLLDQAWAENDEFIMVSGVAGSITDALQVATAGLSNWLKSYFRLDAAEIATVLANSIHYDIAEVVDPQVHVVAKIRKEVLAQLPKPDAPASVFCQAGWGCAPK